MFAYLKQSSVLTLAALGAFLISVSTAQQQPSANAPPHPQRHEAAPQVTGVQLRPHKTGPKPVSCPDKIPFYGVITTNGATKVKYTWVTSDGKSWPDETLNFAAKGLKPVSTEWRVGAPGKKVNAWIQLKTVEPNVKVSTKTTFAITCAK